MHGTTYGAPSMAMVVGTVASDTDVHVVAPGGEVTFGRDTTATLRIGHAPVYDEVVPRFAGRVFAHDGRLVVGNLDDRLAFDISVPSRPLLTVPPGDWHAPRDHSFDIVVAGAFRYELTVTQNSARNPTTIVEGDETGTPDPPTGALPHLTERQRRILDAYVAPLAVGEPVASHQQVADVIGISRSLVRLECNRIWSELLVAGVPMRTRGDTRDEIVDAWSRHRF